MKNLATLVIVLAVFAAACQGNVFDLNVGDCFNNPDSVEVSSVEMTHCSESHDNEVFATFDMTNDEFPGDASTQDIASQGCLDRFESYVGRDYQSSIYDFSSLTPTSQSWDGGDREIVCFLFDLNGDASTGAAKNSGL